jgi:hypothetical protein
MCWRERTKSLSEAKDVVVRRQKEFSILDIVVRVVESLLVLRQSLSSEQSKGSGHVSEFGFGKGGSNEGSAFGR